MAESTRVRDGVITLVATLALVAAGCAGRKAQRTAFLDAEELYATALEQFTRGKLTKARETLGRVQYSVENRTSMEPKVRLLLADVAFHEKGAVSLIEARSMYLDFVTLNGDHPRAPYAQLQAGVCSLLQGHTPTKDQSEMRQATIDLREVIQRYPASPYAKAAGDRIEEVERSLAEHEFIVGRFYFKRNKWTAAADRFQIVRDRYVRYPDQDKILYFLGRARFFEGRETEGRLHLDQLLSDYPHSEWRKQANAFLEKWSTEDAS